MLDSGNSLEFEVVVEEIRGQLKKKRIRCEVDALSVWKGT
jgi:hypothetical protein